MWNPFSRCLDAVPEKIDPVAVAACRVTWQYQHPPEALARSTEACSRAFARWLIEIENEIDAEAISRRQLVSLYAEFCEVHDLRPMPWGRFDRSLKGAGLQRYRSSKTSRPWFYRVIRPGSAMIYKLPPAKLSGQQSRRAA